MLGLLASRAGVQPLPKAQAAGHAVTGVWACGRAGMTSTCKISAAGRAVLDVGVRAYTRELQVRPRAVLFVKRHDGLLLVRTSR